MRRLLEIACWPTAAGLPRRILGSASQGYRVVRRTTTMFSAIRRYTVKQGTVEELIHRVQEGFVPIVRNMPGFRGYYLVNGGPEVLIAIAYLTTRMERLPPTSKRRIGSGRTFWMPQQEGQRSLWGM
jgi:antibiotic biosynthesis monooxygenase